MTQTQRELFDELREVAMVELEQCVIDGTMPGVNLIRARQIMEHPERFPDPRDPKSQIDLLKGEVNAKLQSIEVHLNNHARTKKPLVIFAAFEPQQKMLYDFVKSRGLSVAILDRDKSTTQRDKIDQGFRAGAYQVLICSPPIAGVGYNWQFWGPSQIEVEHVIFASLTYLDTDYLQAMRRFVRQNRKTNLLVTILAYIDSIDQRLFELYTKKSTHANKVDPTREIIQISM
jgi:hypothetical protein